MKCNDLILIGFFCGLFLMFLIMQPHTQNTRPILEIEQIVYCNLDFNSSYKEKQETETKDFNAFDLNKWFLVEVDLSKIDFNSSLCKEGFTPKELSCSCIILL
jgi:hypothetical protein